MTSLFTPPLQPLLARLFAEAEASEAAIDVEFAALPPQEREALIRTTDYRALYSQMKNFYLAVSPEAARLLYMLARAVKARSIVEFGTSFGLSTLHLAAALKDNGGGRVISTEFEAGKVAKARENIAAAGFEDLVEIREGDALETLAQDLPDRIDLVLLDGAKSLYPKILALLEPRFVPGTLIVADNADNSPEYLARMREVKNGYLSVPFAEDVELSLRLPRN